MENVKEVLKLSVEQKGAVVPTGELTVYLDGLTITEQDELATLTNGTSANGNSEHMLGLSLRNTISMCIFIQIQNGVKISARPVKEIYP